MMSSLASYFCRKEDLSVNIVLYGISPVIFYQLPGDIIIHLPRSRFNRKFRLISTIGRLIYLRRTIIRIDPDSILSFGEFFNSFVLIAVFGLRYPVYVSDRCQPDKPLGKFHDYLRKKLYPKATGVIVQTQIAREIYQKRIANVKLTVIGNPILSICTTKHIVKENIILSVGRLIETKHHDELIKLFKQIEPNGWTLVIVGDDAQKQNNMKRLMLLVKELNLEGRVLLPGTRKDVDEFYLKSRIFVSTSSSEGFPNVIGEAMSAGLPVVAFDCVAGPSEMITDGKDGILIPIFDYGLMKEKLMNLMSDLELRERLGNEAKKTIKRFTPDEIGDKYLSLITSRG